jgi:hypothetical protein
VTHCERPYCVLCMTLRQNQRRQEPKRKTGAQRKRERYIRRLKLTGRWIDKTQMKSEKDELKL